MSSKTRITDTMAADAVLGQVGTPTMMSLATKRRSKTLGAGMPTLVRETKRAARTMSTRRTGLKRKTRKTGRKTRKTGLKRKGRKTTGRKTVRKTAKRKITKRKSTACKPRRAASGKLTRRVRVNGKCVAFKGRAHKLALSLGK